jgi:hypothetical protein
MHNLVPQLLPQLKARSLPGFDAGPGMIYPYYEGFSLANLPASICHWLGVPGFGGPPFAHQILDLYEPGFKNVILLVIDGMGLNTLLDTLEQAQHTASYAVWSDLAKNGALAPLTSIVPSTTASALTTFWTGRTPAEHGIVGYEMWLKEYGLIANMIFHSPASFYGETGSLKQAGFNPETFLPVPPFGRHLEQCGVRVRAFQHAAIARSGLSKMLFPGVEVIPFRSQSDLWVTLEGALENSAAGPNYSYIYWGDLDEHSHRFGPHDPRVYRELSAFSRQMQLFIDSRRKRQAGDTLLIITADHGHIDTPRQPEYELRNHPGFLENLVMVPTGEARLPLVHARAGREAQLFRYIEDAWPGQFLVFPAGEAIRAGLFGPGNFYERLPDRTGDFVVVPQGNAYWWFGNRDNPLLGRHGGLSQTEMLVPFFATIL